jgi:hypothetical protein
VTAASDVTRRLDEFGADLKEIALDLKAMRTGLDTTYVRQDVYKEAEARLRQEVVEKAAAVLVIANQTSERVAVVEKRAEAAENTRKLVYLALLSSLVLPLIAALIYHSLKVA